MMHPVGPRSPRVYWLRRALVVALGVVVVIGVAWFVVSRGSSSPANAVDQQTLASDSALTGVLAPPSYPSDSSSSAARGQTSSSHPATTSTAGQAAASSKATSGKTTSGKDASTSAKTTSTTSSKPAATSKPAGSTSAKGTSRPAGTTSHPAGTTRAASTPAKSSTPARPATVTATVTVTVTAGPPKPSYNAQGQLLCPDSAISVVATTRTASFPVGSQPVLGMTVTNVGSVACVRDLSGPLQVYTVYTSAGARVWSTSDCFPGTGTDVRQLAPGQSVHYDIRWAGTTSNPGCTAKRVPVAAGKYDLVAALSGLASAKHPFTMTAAG